MTFNAKPAVLALLLFVVLALPSFAPSAHAWEFYTDCEKYPDTLGCMIFGDPPPAETMPGETRNLQLQQGPMFSGGSCPANLHVSVSGHSVTVLNMAQPCAWIEGYIKPVILLMAAISAVFIVVPRD